jgi:Na+/glutamate symporter
MRLETGILKGTSTWLQLPRFLVTLLVGVAVTRILLMPGSRRLVSKKGDRKFKHSIQNLVSVTGLFLTRIRINYTNRKFFK